MGVWSAYCETRGWWSRKVERWLGRWVYRKPSEVVKSNTKKAFDYFFSQDEFIETDYLRESRLAFYDCIADHCVPILDSLASESTDYRLIDVGCGTGHFLLALQRRVGSAGELFGLDFSSVAVARARSVVPDATIDEGNAYEIPYSDKYFDVVTSLETLEHLKKPRVALDEMVRICKPAGHLVITVPNGSEDDWKGHVNFWTAATLKELLTSVGVAEVIELPEHGALLARVAISSVPPSGAESVAR
jgi:2-polyprenyl-3-methyl-5-hydroxy-6-metoxy-1,4-benzoquinol methylase